MPIESIGGVRLHVQALGHRGSQVFLVHGMTTSLASFYFTIAPPLAEAHRVLMYDLRGHGRSEAVRTGYGVRSMAGDLAGVIDRFGDDDPVDVVGHSFGAAVAMRYAIDHPARVRRLVFSEGPLPVFLPDDDDEFPGAIDPERIRSEVQGVADAALRDLPEDVRRALAGKGRRVRRTSSRATVLFNQTSLMADLEKDNDISDAEIASLRVPIMLCYGTRTLPPMAATLTRLRAVLPQARVRMFDSGHLMLNEQAGPVAGAILEFLADA